MKKIKLTQGKYTLVDDEDFDFLNQWKWCVTKRKCDILYAITNIKSKSVLMHRLIMNTSKGMDTDHINGKGLDNRQSNLRICSHLENQQNRKLNKNNKSGYKGVNWYSLNKKWGVGIRINKKLTFLGLFKNKRDAALAYNKTAKRYFGEFAKLNII